MKSEKLTTTPRVHCAQMMVGESYRLHCKWSCTQLRLSLLLCLQPSTNRKTLAITNLLWLLCVCEDILKRRFVGESVLAGV